jgi:hypothetical protein
MPVHENSLRVLPQMNAFEIKFCFWNFVVAKAAVDSNFVKGRSDGLRF